MKKETKQIKIIYKPYFDFPFSVSYMNEGEKTIHHRRTSSIYVFNITKKNEQLALRHNELIKKMSEIGEQITDIINQMEQPIK